MHENKINNPSKSPNLDHAHQLLAQAAPNSIASTGFVIYLCLSKDVHGLLSAKIQAVFHVVKLLHQGLVSVQLHTLDQLLELPSRYTSYWCKQLCHQLWRRCACSCLFIWFNTAAAAAMRCKVCLTYPDVVSRIIRVRMTNAMFTDTLHDTSVLPPVQRPAAHVMVGWIVDAAELATAF